MARDAGSVESSTSIAVIAGDCKDDINMLVIEEEKNEDTKESAVSKTERTAGVIAGVATSGAPAGLPAGDAGGTGECEGEEKGNGASGKHQQRTPEALMANHVYFVQLVTINMQQRQHSTRTIASTYTEFHVHPLIYAPHSPLTQTHR